MIVVKSYAQEIKIVSKEAVTYGNVVFTKKEIKIRLTYHFVVVRKFANAKKEKLFFFKSKLFAEHPISKLIINYYFICIHLVLIFCTNMLCRIQ